MCFHSMTFFLFFLWAVSLDRDVALALSFSIGVFLKGLNCNAKVFDSLNPFEFFWIFLLNCNEIIIIINPFHTFFIHREKFILEQEIREKEEAIRHQNSEVQVGRKLALNLCQNSLAEKNNSYSPDYLCMLLIHVISLCMEFAFFSDCKKIF